MSDYFLETLKRQTEFASKRIDPLSQYWEKQINESLYRSWYDDHEPYERRSS